MPTKTVQGESRRKPRAPHFVSDEVPLYYQLASLLREKIIAGLYAPGDQISTEADLVEEYGLSRITVRQALRNLEEEGLIRREPGRGTFVTDHQPFAGRLELDGTLEDLISMGLATSVKLLEISDAVATPEDASILKIELGSPMKRVSRLRYYEQEPYSYIVNHIPADIGRKLSRTYLKHGSVLKWLEQDLGIPLRDANQSVRATLADANLARWLHTRIGAPLLFVDRVVRTDDEQPVIRTLTYYRSDIYSFSLHLTRNPQNAKAAHAGWELRQLRKPAK